MSNQDSEGMGPSGPAAGPPAAPAGTPETAEQQLAKEREARALMRDRLRHTEALAAESHALRARMAQELERVTADRDRLRTEAAVAASAVAVRGNAPSPLPRASDPVEPRLTAPPMRPSMQPPIPPPSRAADAPLRPPARPARRGPWRALAMLGGLAAGVACLAWITGSMPTGEELASAPVSAPVAMPTPAASTPIVAAAGEAAPPAASVAPASTAPASLAAAQASSGAVALAPVTPEQQLAAAPTAAGPAPAVAPAGVPDRLRKALDGEGIASTVDVDAATGHVVVADPQADRALRDRTDMVIRAVYAGASLPEPQIEHRWLSPMHGEHPQPAAAAQAPAPAREAAISPAAAYAARHAASAHVADRRKTSANTPVADAEELRPVLPAGRLTESCMEGVAGKSTARRASMTACMKHSCCSSAANHNSEECRAYDKAYPFTCGAG